jgi:hypothetical protein
MQTVKGVGRDSETVTNEHGGKQSHLPYRTDLLPPHALLAVSEVLKAGADKYGEHNWHAIPVAENVNHALTHLLAGLAGDASDEHLEHAATRILFALDQKRSGREERLRKPAPKPKRLPRVYIAGPISTGDLYGNVAQATKVFRDLVDIGVAPWCPHWSVFSGELYVDPEGDAEDGNVWTTARVNGCGLTHKQWLDVDLAWVEAADAVLRLPGESKGADAEVARAREVGIPVFYSVGEVDLWRKGGCPR